MWNWDFDNDGISDSTEQSPVYVYRTQGNYTVNLKASNGLNTDSKIANISVEKRISPTWPFVYITGGLSTLIIDTTTGTVITKVKVGGVPRGIAITPDGKKAYVANSWNGNVSVIDTATNTVTATVTVGAYHVAVTPDGRKVYVTNYGGNDVSVIDTDTNTVIATVPFGNWPTRVAVTPDGKKVYVSSHGNVNNHNNTVSEI